MIGNVPGVDRLLVHGWLRRLRDVGGGGAEQRHNETRECVVVLMTPVSGVLYRARPLIGGDRSELQLERRVFFRRSIFYSIFRA